MAKWLIAMGLLLALAGSVLAGELPTPEPVAAGTIPAVVEDAPVAEFWVYLPLVLGE